MSVNDQCKGAGCDRPATRRGTCAKHYYRLLKYGDVNATFHSSWQDSTESRLRHYGWTETAVVPGLGVCWEWSGLRTYDGYGYMRINYRARGVHRLAYETWVDPIPEGLIVRHRCDNPPCINPEHLELGTHKDNSDDMISRGRDRSRGSRSPRSKLTDEEAVTLVEEYKRGILDQKMLAESYGIAQATAGRIIRGETHYAI